MAVRKTGSNPKRNRPSKSWWSSLLALRLYRYRSSHNDKLLPETRWSAFFVVPFLLAGFVMLTIWPDDTELLFAWSVQSRMTALMLAAAFAGGAYFFSRVYLERQWHRVGMGFFPAITFSLLGGLVTLLNWGTFNHSAVAFIVWIALFATTSWLIPLVWLRNRALDPRMPSVNDVILPRSFRWLWSALAISNLLIGLILFITPGFARGAWPWALTELGARMIGAMFLMFSVSAAAMLIERRWTSAQVVVETVAITFTLVLVGVARSWSEFNLLNPLIWIFVGTILVLLVGLVVLYLWVEVR